jgi:dTDP-glucose pyrophosphorylase
VTTDTARHDLASLTVGTDASIRDALVAVDRGACEIALAVDGGRHLVGVLTDGDLRRALLDGHGLEADIAPFLTREPLVVGPDAHRAEVLDLMTARAIAQVPVVDEQGVLVGLHILNDLVGGRERPNWAVIMAGGRGKRLAPLTDELPKPMLRVAGRPILERLVLHLVGAGVRRIVLAVGYRSGVIEDHFGDGREFGCRIDYLHESPEHPLGTGGPLALVPQVGEAPCDPLVVLNGDLVTQFSVGELLDHHTASGAAVTVAVREYRHEVPFGVIEADQDDRITGIVEKPSPSWTVNAGIYVIEPRLLERVATTREYPLPELIADCIARHEPVGSWHLEDDWDDVGRPQDLRRARGEL